MSQSPTLPDFDEISADLAATKTDLNAAQVHGLLCGYIAATSGQLDQRWEKILLGSKKDPKLREILQQLLEVSYHQMSEFSFEFSLLLPDDETSLASRAESLGLWCQGFLTGLEQCNVPIQNREESEVTEALNDIMEISQVSFDDPATSEEDETAYFELVEYVRLAILMIFQELRGPQDTTSEEDSNRQLH